MNVEIVKRLPVDRTNIHYVSNRDPLLVNALIKLPLGTIRPRGWLKRQLELMVEGMTGRLPELSQFLREDNGWFGGDNEGWEEQPYWLRGFHDLAVLTGSERLAAEAERWIEAVLASQDDSGYFGARYHKRIVGKNGQTMCDLWPHMVMLDAMIHHHEHTGDSRVLPMMTRFFAFCRDLPDDLFLPPGGFEGFGDWKPFVQHSRAGDMLPHIFWLYNRTGQSWLLDLARRFFGRIAPPQDEWLDHHVVHFTQRFGYPGVYYALSGDRRHRVLTEYWYAQHMSTWGQQPRGIFGADELIRPGKVDPRQGFETCGMTEFAKSFYLLGQQDGDPLYADQCEDIMLNHFPAAQTPDLKALHYLTASNQPQLDASERHDYSNTGRQICYSPHIYRCCQHNVAMGWPWYAQHLWQATQDDGLAAWMYAASALTARVGREEKQVTIDTETAYPFRSAVRMTVSAPDPIQFPIYLRVPRWCKDFRVALNGETLDTRPTPQTYVCIERAWSEGDTIEVEMPMDITLTEWPRSGSVTVDRGPLSYSIRIEEEWRRAGGNDDWPEWEVFPTTPWNYGLLVDRGNPEASLRVKERGLNTGQPWTLDNAPVEIVGKAKRIPGWGLENETVEELRFGPIRSEEPEETVRMIPLGCARLRMSCLPSIGDGPESREWKRHDAVGPLICSPGS